MRARRRLGVPLVVRQVVERGVANPGGVERARRSAVSGSSAAAPRSLSAASPVRLSDVSDGQRASAAAPSSPTCVHERSSVATGSFCKSRASSPANLLPGEAHGAQRAQVAERAERRRRRSGPSRRSSASASHRRARRGARTPTPSRAARLELGVDQLGELGGQKASGGTGAIVAERAHRRPRGRPPFSLRARLRRDAHRPSASRRRNQTACGTPMSARRPLGQVAACIKLLESSDVGVTPKSVRESLERWASRRMRSSRPLIAALLDEARAAELRLAEARPRGLLASPSGSLFTAGTLVRLALLRRSCTRRCASGCSP